MGTDRLCSDHIYRKLTTDAVRGRLCGLERGYASCAAPLDCGSALLLPVIIVTSGAKLRRLRTACGEERCWSASPLPLRACSPPV